MSMSKPIEVGDTVTVARLEPTYNDKSLGLVSNYTLWNIMKRQLGSGGRVLKFIKPNIVLVKMDCVIDPIPWHIESLYYDRFRPALNNTIGVRRRRVSN